MLNARGQGKGVFERPGHGKWSKTAAVAQSGLYQTDLGMASSTSSRWTE